MWRVRATDHRDKPIRLVRSAPLPAWEDMQRAMLRGAVSTHRGAPAASRIAGDLAHGVGQGVQVPKTQPTKLGPLRLLRRLLWSIVFILTRGPVVVGIGAVLMIGVLIGLAIEQGPMGLALGLTSPVSIQLILAGFVLGGFATRLPAWRAVRIARAMLSARRCPCCGYDLSRGPEPEHDGCVVCPECASAWRADRLGVPANAPAEVVVIRVPRQDIDDLIDGHDGNDGNTNTVTLHARTTAPPAMTTSTGLPPNS